MIVSLETGDSLLLEDDSVLTTEQNLSDKFYQLAQILQEIAEIYSSNNS
jgi:hypothetical protein